MESTVPLDARGHPIASEEDLGGAADQGYTVELDETIHLTSRRASEDSGDVSAIVPRQTTLIHFFQQHDDLRDNVPRSDLSPRESEALLFSSREGDRA